MNKSITLQLLRNIAQVEARILSANYYEDQTEIKTAPIFMLSFTKKT